MAKILYANGCSWTFGDGLDTDPLVAHIPDREDRRQHATSMYAWPPVLAQLIGRSHINEGIGAGSNARIVRTTCNYLMNTPRDNLKDLLVVIGWTSIERDEIYIHGGVGPSGWYNFNAQQQFSTNQHIQGLDAKTCREIDEYQKTYITRIYNHDVNLQTYYRQQYLLANLLENLGVKYLFFNSLFYLPPAWPEADEVALQDKIKTPNMILDITFACYLVDRNIVLSECGHPLEDGHRLWAEFLHANLVRIYGDDL